MNYTGVRWTGEGNGHQAPGTRGGVQVASFPNLVPDA
jgi:hypothetical protein